MKFLFDGHRKHALGSRDLTGHWLDSIYVHAAGRRGANDGHDTRAIQQYRGHRNIPHTVPYTPS